MFRRKLAQIAENCDHNIDPLVSQFYSMAAIAIAPFISSLTIVDPPQGSGGE
jgi:hypothetical protein